MSSLTAWLARHRRRWRRRQLRVVRGGLQRMPIAQRLHPPDAPRTLRTVTQRRVKAS
ncbi:hypothetical protein K2Z84_13945 [Candidatus Binatia bacterium]|nr:hypothetical protein [Candidatus Binatia bacterium]